MARTYPPTLVSAPEEPVVSPTEALSMIPGASSSNLVLIAALIGAATAKIDGPHGDLGRCIVRQTWAQTFDAFDTVLYLPMPALEVTEIRYTDSEGDEQIVDTAVYVLRHDIAKGSYVTLKKGQSWPTPIDDEGAVTVEFEAGFGDAADVPQDIKQAVKLSVATLFQTATRDMTLTMDRVDGVGTYQWDNSGALSQAVDRAFASLIGRYRVPSL